ncbi:hypothetical protein L873DRAFT_1815810 [Choiromyces venosus 120613-1]|uniref:Uncharacterized protein n=1 Tax=Choiromyces venosus 120613-1 TaxID=1336337 RepID=A0A3N4JHZ3_9PEZI|nr:hypothetical protein L873DRAFT_1815810 [Choiromyces venosus 120613-1]
MNNTNTSILRGTTYTPPSFFRSISTYFGKAAQTGVGAIGTFKSHLGTIIHDMNSVFEAAVGLEIGGDKKNPEPEGQEITTIIDHVIKTPRKESSRQILQGPQRRSKRILKSSKKPAQDKTVMGPRIRAKPTTKSNSPILKTSPGSGVTKKSPVRRSMRQSAMAIKAELNSNITTAETSTKTQLPPRPSTNHTSPKTPNIATGSTILPVIRLDKPTTAITKKAQLISAPGRLPARVQRQSKRIMESATLKARAGGGISKNGPRKNAKGK